jgi:hypothetical protein
MTKKATTMHLEANFDIDQVGGTLEWHFERRDHDGNPITGKYAGGIYYTIGEEMRVRVKAGSRNKLASFKILDCTLITRPQIVEIAPKKKAKFAPPSPFITTVTPEVVIIGASINLPGEEFKRDGIVPPTPAGYSEIALLWNKHLTVGQNEGRWEFSFVVTVQVTPEDGPACERVFSFDPEMDVGNGVTPP